MDDQRHLIAIELRRLDSSHVESIAKSARAPIFHRWQEVELEKVLRGRLRINADEDMTEAPLAAVFG